MSWLSPTTSSGDQLLALAAQSPWITPAYSAWLLAVFLLAADIAANQMIDARVAWWVTRTMTAPLPPGPGSPRDHPSKKRRYCAGADASVAAGWNSPPGCACRMTSTIAAVWQLAALSLVCGQRGLTSTVRRQPSWYTAACCSCHNSCGASAAVLHLHRVWKVAMTCSRHIACKA
jgi:hypothetical protein